MKKVLAIVLALVSISAFSQVHVKGHVKKDGTYVEPTVRSAPNATKDDNYSTKGNENPYNGKSGTVNPQTQPSYEMKPAKTNSNKF